VVLSHIWQSLLKSLPVFGGSEGWGGGVCEHVAHNFKVLIFRKLVSTERKTVWQQSCQSPEKNTDHLEWKKRRKKLTRKENFQLA
jgi:hypothetical protein